MLRERVECVNYEEGTFAQLVRYGSGVFEVVDRRWLGSDFKWLMTSLCHFFSPMLHAGTKTSTFSGLLSVSNDNCMLFTFAAFLSPQHGFVSNVFFVLEDSRLPFSDTPPKAASQTARGCRGPA